MSLSAVVICSNLEHSISLSPAQEPHQGTYQQQHGRHEHEDHNRLTLPTMTQDDALSLFVLVDDNPACLPILGVEASSVHQVVPEYVETIVLVLYGLACHTLELDSVELDRV